MAEPPVPADGNPSTDDTSEITDTDDSTAVDQPQAKKRWADLFNETEAKVEKPVEEDNSKYTVFIPHILEIIEEQKRMAEQLTIDDYTTLPGKSGATHSISLCIAKFKFCLFPYLLISVIYLSYSSLQRASEPW